MAVPMIDPNDQLSEAETERRREAALKRMLNSPPQPHAKSAPIRKKGKTKGRPVKPKSTAI
jgi:hypothetical protein